MQMMFSAPLAFFGLICASAVTGLTIQKRAVDFFDPALGGGSIFANATFGGEPLNVRPSRPSCPTSRLHQVSTDGDF